MPEKDRACIAGFVSRDGHARGELREWDSEFFGIRIGSVSATALTTAGADEVDRWANAHGVRCLYLFADATDAATRNEAEARGYQLMDTRVTYAAPTGRTSNRHQPADAGTARVAAAADLPALKAIARASHENTRFYRDPRFGRDRCAALYERWIERSCDAWADRVFVVGGVGDPLGYATIHGGVLGLVAVRADMRRRGVGYALLSAISTWLAEAGTPTFRALTQHDNQASRRMLEGMGGQLDSITVAYHRWSDSADI